MARKYGSRAPDSRRFERLMHIKIPTYDYATGEWSHTEFVTRETFCEFLWSMFKQPGQYEFDECSLLFNKQARRFNIDKFYCPAPPKSKDFVAYWDTEKDKCRNGVIYKNGKKTWYLTRDYYMWLNFLPSTTKRWGSSPSRMYGMPSTTWPSTRNWPSNTTNMLQS